MTIKTKDNFVTYSESELEAFRLIGHGFYTTESATLKIKKAADKIIELAEKIKSERVAANEQ